MSDTVHVRIPGFPFTTSSPSMETTEAIKCVRLLLSFGKRLTVRSNLGEKDKQAHRYNQNVILSYFKNESYFKYNIKTHNKLA